jgi:hypothetical protein
VASGTTVVLLQLYTAETGFGRMESEEKLATNNMVITMWWVAAAEKQQHQVLAIVMALLFLFRKEDHLLQRGFPFVGSWCFFVVSLSLPLPQKKFANFHN